MRSARAPLMLVAVLLALLCSAPTVGAAPAITITPPSGPPRTEFVAELRGFTPGETVALRLTTGEATPRSLNIPAITIDAAGGYRLAIPALGLTPGEYILAALRSGEVVASARFTVVAPAATPTRAPATPPRPTATSGPVPSATMPMPTPPSTGSGGYLPGLPNTGGGGGIDGGAVSAILAVALLLALAALHVGRNIPDAE